MLGMPNIRAPAGLVREHCCNQFHRNVCNVHDRLAAVGLGCLDLETHQKEVKVCK